MYSGVSPVLSATSKDVNGTQITNLNLALYVLSKMHQCNCFSFLCNIILNDAADYGCLSWMQDARCPSIRSRSTYCLNTANPRAIVLSKMHQCNCFSFLCNIILSDAADYSCLSWMHDARCPSIRSRSTYCLNTANPRAVYLAYIIM